MDNLDDIAGFVRLDLERNAVVKISDDFPDQLLIDGSNGPGARVIIDEPIEVTGALDLANVQVEIQAGGSITVKSGGTLRFSKANVIGSYSFGSPVTIKDGGLLVMTGGTMQFGSSSEGGLIRAEGDACISDARLSESYASQGGAIAVLGRDANVEVERVDFSSTLAEFGGAIAASDQATVTITGGSTTGVDADLGGAIYASDDAHVTIRDAVWSGSRPGYSYSYVYDYPTASGGALYADTGSTLTISNTAFSNWAATADGGVVTVNDAQVDLIDVVLFNTSAPLGGAIAAFNGATVNVLRGSVQASSGVVGGVVFATDRATIDVQEVNWYGSNLDAQAGGAIYIDGGSTLTASTSSFVGWYAALQGGALFVGRGSTASLTDVSVLRSTADEGGAVYAEGSVTWTRGTVCDNLGSPSVRVAPGSNLANLFLAQNEQPTIAVDGDGPSGKATANNLTITDEVRNPFGVVSLFGPLEVSRSLVRLGDGTGIATVDGDVSFSDSQVDYHGNQWLWVPFSPYGYSPYGYSSYRCSLDGVPFVHDLSPQAVGATTAPVTADEARQGLPVAWGRHGGPDASPEWALDVDGDGWVAAYDVFDTFPRRHPGQPEDCSDGVDNNGDGLIDRDPGYLDADGDGYGTDAWVECADGRTIADQNGDCDDDDVQIGPGQAETCDEVDNNCDGVIDEGVAITGYHDGDGDGFGAGDLITACDAVPTNDDCDDADVAVGGPLLGYPDGDDDSFGDQQAEQVVACGTVANNDDCDDGDDEIKPGAREISGNRVDEDCDSSKGTTWVKGSGCAVGPGAASWGAVALGLLALRRRRAA